MVNGSNHYRLPSLYSPMVRGFTQRMARLSYLQRFIKKTDSKYSFLQTLMGIARPRYTPK